MGKVKVENIRVFAYHGCLSEETKIGSDYRVDLSVKANLSVSAVSDRLEDTIDYVTLNHIVNKEMAKPSHLLETVAQRILERILLEHELIDKVSVCISKLNPPINGDVEKVTVEVSQKRKKQK